VGGHAGEEEGILGTRSVELSSESWCRNGVGKQRSPWYVAAKSKQDIEEEIRAETESE
jgi:hypothetical protein